MESDPAAWAPLDFWGHDQMELSASNDGFIILQDSSAALEESCVEPDDGRLERVPGSSAYLGVTPENGQWRARDNIGLSLGLFFTEIGAARARMRHYKNIALLGRPADPASQGTYAGNRGKRPTVRHESGKLPFAKKPRPAGRAPKGANGLPMVWNPAQGAYVEAAELVSE